MLLLMMMMVPQCFWWRRTWCSCAGFCGRRVLPAPEGRGARMGGSVARVDTSGGLLWGC